MVVVDCILNFSFKLICEFFFCFCKIYIEGFDLLICVLMCEIELLLMIIGSGDLEFNVVFFVYDMFGVYIDLDVLIDVIVGFNLQW